MTTALFGGAAMIMQGKVGTVRHGATDFSKAGLIAGTKPVPLSATGAVEAKMSACSLQNQGVVIQSIVSSSMARGTKTAAIHARVLGVPPEQVFLEDGLRDRCYGVYEGLPYVQMRDECPNWFIDGPPKGESFAQVVHRVRQSVDRRVWPQIQQGKNVLIVSHVGVILAIRHLLLGTSFEELSTLHVLTSVPEFLDFAPLTLLESPSVSIMPQTEVVIPSLTS